MQFRDGYWRIRPGAKAHFPTQVYEVTGDNDRLRVLAPCRPVAGRADTLGGPVLTIEATAPIPGAVAVRVTHHRGSVRRSARPELPGRLPPGELQPKIEIDSERASLTSGDLTVSFDRTAWGVTFSADGRVLTRSGHHDLAIVEMDGSHHLVEQLELGIEEHLYGLGERFGAFVKNGQRVDIWNADGGTASELAYKNVAFHLSDAGYGVFVNHPGPVSYEIGSQTVGRAQFSVEDHELEYVVIHGPSPAEILERYTELTGRPALPPRWSFGLWLTTSFTTDYDEATVTGFVDGMAERDLPFSVFHFDCFWMRGYRWSDLEWDPETFPDPGEMLARLKERDLRICVWINPYIAQESRLFDEGAEQGYLVRRPDGTVWQWDEWQPGMGLVDFTNPEAREWFAAGLEALLDQGVDCFKTDFGERIPTDVVYHDGSDPELMHNVYTHLYNQTVFDLLRRRRGEGDAVMFARSAMAGGQQFPVHWGGDCESTFQAMYESLRGGLSLGLSGFGYWSHDIGGFEGTPDPEVFKRWIAFGLLSSHSRLHGSKSYRVPWLIDDESVDVLRSFTQLKLSLLPYLWSAAVEAHQRGLPMLRAMVLEFPDDPACAHLDRQYLLGGRLLVAPVLRPGGSVQYYVPAGRWTSLVTGEVVEGPGWRTENHDVFSLPLLVRPGTLLATGPATTGTRPESDLTASLLLRVYELADGETATARVPDDAGGPGTTFTATRSGGTVTVQRSGPSGPWRVALGGAVLPVPAGGGQPPMVTVGAEVDRCELPIEA
jgi:alpha-D-xyloside xylohydrolase